MQWILQQTHPTWHYTLSFNIIIQLFIQYNSPVSLNRIFHDTNGPCMFKTQHYSHRYTESIPILQPYSTRHPSVTNSFTGSPSVNSIRISTYSHCGYKIFRQLIFIHTVNDLALSKDTLCNQLLHPGPVCFIILDIGHSCLFRTVGPTTSKYSTSRLPASITYNRSSRRIAINSCPRDT